MKDDQIFWMTVGWMLAALMGYCLGLGRGWNQGFQEGFRAGETIHSLRELKYKQQGELSERN